jgi:hypothetical protein
MNSRSSWARLRTHATRAALVSTTAVLAAVATPGVASAAGEVTPVLNCIKRVSADADWIAVLGYVNSSAQPVTYPRGPSNRLVPSTHDGGQPTTFQPGTVNGAFTETFNANETATWTVSGRSLTITRNGPACPPSAELPAAGNGTGPVIALAAAGVVGGVLVHRAKRRASAPTAGSGDDA